MITCDSSEFSYKPGPSCPDWHGHPDQSLLDLFKTNRAALYKDDRPWYAGLKSHGSKARKRKIDLDKLAIGYDSLSNLVKYTMICRNSLTIDNDLAHMHELVGCIERQRDLIETCADPLSEQQISKFDDCRARAFRAEVLYLMTAEQRQRGTIVCLDKAEKFCTSGVGGMCATALCDASLMLVQRLFIGLKV
jgi:hypothetical protein